MWKTILHLIRDIWSDGYKFFGAIAPLASLGFTLAKALEVHVSLRDISYAWAFVPLLAWLFMAYIRRWLAYRALEDTIKSSAHRLPRHLAYERTDLVTEANCQNAVINSFRLVVHNNGPETLLWRVKHLSLFVDGAKLYEMAETAMYPVPGTRCSDHPIKFIPPHPVANGAKQVTAEIEISYDNDPPLGIRTVWQKVEYPIAWFTTQAPLFNTFNVVAHREG